jgi:L-threonylcarbamoyladenylate synthase
VARALLEAAGVPVAAPSANASTRLSPTRAEHVLLDLNGRVDLILDGGATPGGLESTVLDLTSTPPRLLRPGLVPPAEIEAVVGPIARRGPAAAEISAVLPSPGLMRRHYAPRARLHCTEDEGRACVDELCDRGARVGWLTFAAAEERPGLTVVTMPRDAAAYAARLYDALHNLDAAGVDHIVVALPPDRDDWLAVRDRLRRAAVQP